MPYIGTDINYGNLAKQTGTGDGADTTPIAALTYTVPSSESILVFLDGVCQVPSTDFTATGTTLTFTTAPANGVAILVMFLGRSLDIGTPADNTVDETKLKDALIGDFSDVTVTAADTFLYGDATDSGNTKKDTVQGILDLAGSAGLNFISRVPITSSTATADFLTSFSSTYDNYMATWDICQPVDDNEPFCMKVAQGGSAVTGGYDRGQVGYTEAAATAHGGGAAHDLVYLTAGNVGNASVEEHTSGTVWIFNPLHTAPTSITHLTSFINASTNIVVVAGAWVMKSNSTAVTGIQFLYESGNILIGNFTLYGLAKS
ncbi:uncharacterized protein METZ01_LOCUS46654 [marine metagenome]|uniref:Uncharacterized protein n=1 Tax=marine metagenome TaxID=408172 RepID=A0A381RPJ7_9ZZZZ